MTDEKREQIEKLGCIADDVCRKYKRPSCFVCDTQYGLHIFRDADTAKAAFKKAFAILMEDALYSEANIKILQECLGAEGFCWPVPMGDELLIDADDEQE